jgi:hypothetical protein
MSKHDDMREKVATWSREARQDMRQYITDYEQLERDVKRYFELVRNVVWEKGLFDEYKALGIKLKKVGKEE